MADKKYLVTGRNKATGHILERVVKMPSARAAINNTRFLWGWRATIIGAKEIK